MTRPGWRKGTGQSDELEGQGRHSGGGLFRRRRVDPCRGWFGGRNGRLVHEASGVFTKRLIEGDLTGGVNGVGLAVVDLVRRHQPDPGMVMVLVVPGKEASAENFSVLDTAEAFGEPGLILQRLEMAFGERIVVGCVRAVMRSGHTEISQQKYGGLGFHRAAPIGVQGELTGRYVVFDDRIVEQRLEQGGTLGIGHTPADHAG